MPKEKWLDVVWVTKKYEQEHHDKKTLQDPTAILEHDFVTATKRVKKLYLGNENFLYDKGADLGLERSNTGIIFFFGELSTFPGNKHQNEVLVPMLISSVDKYLFATVLLIFSMGLYKKNMGIPQKHTKKELVSGFYKPDQYG